MQAPTIVWLRQDLRLEDNPALNAALARNQPIIFLYTWAPTDEGGWPLGSASRFWLHASLERLSEVLKERGARLILRSGTTHLAALLEVVRESRAGAVYWSRCYEPHFIAVATKVKTKLRQEGLEVESFNGHLLFEPWEIATKQDTPFQVFTPFWNCCSKLLGQIASPLKAPKNLHGLTKNLKSEPLSLLLPKKKIHLASGTQAPWQPGEEGAKKALSHFCHHGADEYATLRDRPDLPGTSHLSPHLHFGEISARTVWHKLQSLSQKTRSAALKTQYDAYTRQLGWREFAHHLLYHFPHTPKEPLHALFARFPWSRSMKALTAWQKGETGYPIVDAAMRELAYSGWMHNRARLITASFLVKDLLLPWTEGSRWFWEHLVDADLANNTMGWQWVAGCGADAAPYFRIFNPITQSQKFDPEGTYIRTWLPELKRLPTKWLHHPFEAPSHVLQEAGVELGINYPYPIVDHDEARLRALEIYGKLKEKGKD